MKSTTISLPLAREIDAKLSINILYDLTFVPHRVPPRVVVTVSTSSLSFSLSSFCRGKGEEERDEEEQGNDKSPCITHVTLRPPPLSSISLCLCLGLRLSSIFSNSFLRTEFGLAGGREKERRRGARRAREGTTGTVMWRKASDQASTTSKIPPLIQTWTAQDLS